MTTIVYKDGVIAYDSRMTAGDMLVSDKYNKLFKRKGVRFILAGSECDFEDFIELYFTHKTKKRVEVENPIDCEGFAFKDGKIELLSCSGEEFWIDLIKEPWAIGSGQDYAWGALEMGATAKQAVNVAKKKDVKTGGRVREVKI